MLFRYCTIKKAAEVIGYTANAINLKIDKGVWLEGYEWLKSPDGRRLIDLEGVERWVQGQRKMV